MSLPTAAHSKSEFCLSSSPAVAAPRRHSRLLPCLWAAAFATALAGPGARQTTAQIRVQLQPGNIIIGQPPGQGDSPVIFAEDRNVNRALDKARQEIADENYADAVRLLADVLKIKEDFFYQREGQSANRVSVKAEARRLLGSLPLAGREQFELLSGVEARRLLDQAAAAGDYESIADIAARYFHTQAGYQATWLLAQHLRDRGQPLGAALCLRQLIDTPEAVSGKFQPHLSYLSAACWYQAGFDDLAAAELQALKQRQPDGFLDLGGQRRALFAANQDPLAWLASQLPKQSGLISTGEQWLVHRGDAARNQSIPLHSPVVATAWRAPFYDEFHDPNGESGETHLDRGVIEAAQIIAEMYAAQGEPLLPATQAVVAGDRVVFRTATQLVAVDQASGKRVWTAGVDPTVQQLLRTAASQAGRPAPNNPQNNIRGLPQPGRQTVATSLIHRLTGDATYGTLSSDGDQVFAIEDVPLAPQTPNYRIVNGVVQQAGRRSYNTLRAYEASSGKLKWELGGPQSDFELELAGCWFMGPPLPLAGLLYALVEIDSEVRLVALDHHAEEGRRVLWSQSLCMVEQTYPGDQARRQAGVSPSFADGVLVCPTAAGAAVAVDLSSRSLLWAYSFPADVSASPRQRWIINTSKNLLTTSGWSDSTATIDSGRVLFTPVGSNKLFGLSLMDGSELWEPVDRGDALYVGGVYQGRAVLVGSEQVRAVQLDTGRVVWSTRFPQQRQPAGRGYLAGDRYVVPLNDGLVAQVAFDTGDIVLRPLGDSTLEPKAIGNLIAVGERVYCVSLDGCDSHLSVSPSALEERLAANERDAEAWTLRGDILLQQDKVAEAADCLRRAVSFGGDHRAKDLLALCLLKSLQADFTKHQQLRAELEPLLVRPATAARYWRVVGEGLAANNDLVGSMTAYLRLAGLQLEDETLHELEPALLVRREHLVQDRLRSLWEAASDAQRQQMAPLVQQQLQQAAVSTDAEALRRSLAQWGWHPESKRLRWRLAEQLASQDSRPWLQMEQALLPLADLGDRTEQAEAVALLAKIFTERKQWPPAAFYAQRLRGEFADDRLSDGQTGAALAATLLGQPELEKFIQPAVWPLGKATGTSATVQVPAKGRTWGVHQILTPLPQFSGVSFEIENNAALVARSAEKELWRTRFIDPYSNETLASSQHGQSLGAHGHLVVLSTGCYLLGIDTLGTATERPGEIRWVQPLSDMFPSVGIQRMFPIPQWETMAWGEARVRLRLPTGVALGSMAPVVGRQTTFIRGGELVSVHTETGEIVWVRKDAPSGGEVFGDEHVVYVVPASGNRATAYRVADGARLGEKTVPAAGQRMRALGSRVLTWSTNGQQVTVRLFDVEQQQDVWSRTFDSSAKAAFSSDGRLAVLERGGRFQLLEPTTGDIAIDAKVDAMNSLAAIYVLRHQDRYVLAATQSPVAGNRNQNGWMIRPLQNPSVYDAPSINGYLHGFDAQGRLAWSQSARDVALPLHQPEGSPLLCFMSYLYGNRVPVNGRRVGVVQQFCLVFVDKRDGRVAHRHTLGGIPSFYELTANPTKRTVEFAANIGTVRVELSDEAWPADEKSPAIEPEITELPAAQPQPQPRPQPQPVPVPLPQPVPPNIQPRPAPPQAVPLPEAIPLPAPGLIPLPQGKPAPDAPPRRLPEAQPAPQPAAPQKAVRIETLPRAALPVERALLPARRELPLEPR